MKENLPAGRFFVNIGISFFFRAIFTREGNLNEKLMSRHGDLTLS